MTKVKCSSVTVPHPPAEYVDTKGPMRWALAGSPENWAKKPRPTIPADTEVVWANVSRKGIPRCTRCGRTDHERAA